jgi:hypothetical protein
MLNKPRRDNFHNRSIQMISRNYALILCASYAATINGARARRYPE